MKRSGVNAAILHRKTGLSRPTLHRIAKGHGNPQLANLVKIAAALGAQLGELLGPQSNDAVGSMSTDNERPFLALPPRGDNRAIRIYRALLALDPIDKIRQLVHDIDYPFPWEKVDTAINRAVLDVFYGHMVSIDVEELPREHALEKRVAEEFDLRPVGQLVDPSPVRVVNISPNLYPLIQLHAVAGMAASVLRELLVKKDRLAFGDGFAASAILNYLRRGDLAKSKLIPLVYTPGWDLELSGPTLLGTLARSHQGYNVTSQLDYTSIPKELESVQVAVTSCGSAEADPESRLARLIRDLHPTEDYPSILNRMQRKRVVGDVMYHFMRENGSTVDLGFTKHLEQAKPAELRGRKASGGPIIYSASLDYLASVAEREASVLVAHSASRAAVVRAALARKRRPANMLILSRGVAEKLVGE